MLVAGQVDQIYQKKKKTFQIVNKNKKIFFFYNKLKTKNTKITAKQMKQYLFRSIGWFELNTLVIRLLLFELEINYKFAFLFFCTYSDCILILPI